MLLERENAVQDFLELVSNTANSGKVLLVSGEAGIGKTSLLEHMRQHPQINNTMLWSGCDPLFTPQPYAPFQDIASSLSNPLVNLLAKNQNPSKISHKIASTLFSSLEQLNEPIILIIEDVHWADNATLDLLKFLVRRISFVKCLLCLTYRDDEVLLSHPLSTVLSLCPSAHTKRIQLQPLSLNAIEILSAHERKQPWPRNVADKVHSSTSDLYRPSDLLKITAGNPFFLSEILANNTFDSNTIPSSIRDAIGARLSHLKQPEQDLMLTLSLIPYSIPVRLIEHLFPKNGETLAMACIARKLLQFDTQGEFRFRHELARLATLACLSITEQKRLHLKILNSLERLKLTANLAWLSHHAEGGHNASKILKYAPLSAEKAANLGAHKEAASYYEKALKYVEYADTQLAASLYENWAYEVSLTTHMNTPVIEARRCAITLWRALNRLDKIGENLRSLSRLYWYQGQAERAEHYANEAISTFEQLPASTELAMAYSMRSQLDMLNERTSDAVFWGEKALALEQTFPNPLVKVHALTNIGSALLMSGNAEGELMLKNSLLLSEQHGMHEETARVYTNYSDYCVRFKRLSLAEELTTKGIQYDTSHDLDSWTYYLVGIQAQLRLEQGRLVDAQTIAQGVQKLTNQTVLMKLPALIVLARTHIRMGLADAESILQKALSQATAIGEWQYIIPLRLAYIEYAYLTHNSALATEHIAPLVKLQSSILNPWQFGELLVWQSRFGLSQIATETSRSDIPLPWVLELKKDNELAFNAWSDLGMPFNAAMALLHGHTQNTVASFVNAYSLLQSMQAKAVLRYIRKQAQQAGFIDQLPKRQRGPYSKSRQHPLGLTAKEQQIFKLLATGASNQDIAKTVSRSQRTIENHVSSILSKLSVESRIEAILRVQNEPWLLR
ncbi:AAA family ATPase [Glaciecola sp. SC05]|uniref:AAA family ATPase n=1 Tax=Glaciecola sp. SC05 TaxID=1987355 RepID=UPI003527F7C9